LNNLEIFIKSWEKASIEAYSIRQEVFIQEQGVPEEMELDEFDPGAVHVLAYQNGQCVATARLVRLDAKSAQIGRMAVLVASRGRGIGKAILKELIELAISKGISNLVLHSQVSAISFYEKLGFKAQGAIYDEAGIPHRNMILLLQRKSHP
jgi:predicted GNAT family N-acyltransferase